MKEFNLTTKKELMLLYKGYSCPCDEHTGYKKEDVKEFIKRLKEVIDPRIVGAVCCVDMLEEIDKLAGDDLNGS